MLGVDWERRRFLGRALGALAGLLLARHAGQAAAAPPPPTSGGLPIRRSRQLEGKERAQALERFRTHPDLQALGLAVPQENGEFPIVVAHELTDGNILIAAGWVQGPNEVVVTYTFARPWSPEGKALRLESEAPCGFGSRLAGGAERERTGHRGDPGRGGSRHPADEPLRRMQQLLDRTMGNRLPILRFMELHLPVELLRLAVWHKLCSVRDSTRSFSMCDMRRLYCRPLPTVRFRMLPSVGS
ncbi:hypothetical protein [Thermoflexus hugenholtzii]